MKIEGMMCGHCEARVKKTLEAIDGVERGSCQPREQEQRYVTLRKRGC